MRPESDNSHVNERESMEKPESQTAVDAFADDNSSAFCPECQNRYVT